MSDPNAMHINHASIFSQNAATSNPLKKLLLELAVKNCVTPEGIETHKSAAEVNLAWRGKWQKNMVSEVTHVIGMMIQAGRVHSASGLSARAVKHICERKRGNGGYVSTGSAVLAAFALGLPVKRSKAPPDVLIGVSMRIYKVDGTYPLWKAKAFLAVGKTVELGSILTKTERLEVKIHAKMHERQRP